MIPRLAESLENTIPLLLWPLRNNRFNGILLKDGGLDRNTKSTIVNNTAYPCTRFFVIESGQDAAWIHTSARAPIAFGKNTPRTSKLLAGCRCA